MRPFIAKIIERACITAKGNQSLRDIALILAKQRIGAVPVLNEKDALCGIISERDFVRCISDGIDLDNTLVETVMTKKLVTVDTEVNSQELMTIMTTHKIRHVPIMDGSRLMGIVSIGDVVNRLMHKLEEESESLRAFINA